MIFCSDCGACGPVFTYETTSDDEKAKAAWNSRSSYELSQLFIFHDHSGNRTSFSSFCSKAIQRLFSKKKEKITILLLGTIALIFHGNKSIFRQI